MDFELYLAEKPPRGWSRTIPFHNELNYYGSGSHRRSPTYQSWYNMLIRGCQGMAHPCRANYADVRIWTGFIGDTGFSTFLGWMGERPKGLTLDRIDPTGHYVPGNLQWATPSEQILNQRRRQ